MGRPKGSRNADYQAKREALAMQLIPRLLQPDGIDASMREFARCADVSVPTLRHYFDDRDGLVSACLEVMQGMGAPHLVRAADDGLDGGLHASLMWVLREFVEGWRNGIGQMVTVGLVAGVGNTTIGPTYVSTILEPTLQSLERRLAHHAQRGELQANADLRHASLTLMCPVILGLMHQGPLSGSTLRPLDVEAFLEDHVARFVRGWSP